LYWEDADLSIKLKGLGLELVVVPTVKFWHQEGGSGGAVGRSSDFYYYMARNRDLVCSTHAANGFLWFSPTGVGWLLWEALREPVGRFRRVSSLIVGLSHGRRRISGSRSQYSRSKSESR
jgi:GT2 family glycosyltransferase